MSVGVKGLADVQVGGDDSLLGQVVQWQEALIAEIDATDWTSFGQTLARNLIDSLKTMLSSGGEQGGVAEASSKTMMILTSQGS